MKSFLEEDIIRKIGYSSAQPGVMANDYIFDEQINLIDQSPIYAFYTFEGELCLLNMDGYDCDFSGYDEFNQELIHLEIMEGRYKRERE